MIKFLHLTRYWLVLVLLTAILTNCKKDDDDLRADFKGVADFQANVAEDWLELSLKLTKESPGYSPPVAARAFGYSGLALYEALVPGMPDHRSLEGQVNGLAPGTLPAVEAGADYHWGLVANAALAQIYRKFYRNTSAENLSAIDALEHDYMTQFMPGLTDAVRDRSLMRGRAVAEAVYAHANTDGQEECAANNFPADFVPPVGPGFWVPTPPGFQKTLQPYWGLVRPFLTKNVTETQPAGPPPYSTAPTSLFYSQALEVYSVVKALKPGQETIARYWSDDPGATATPPGHSVSVLVQVLRKENADLALAAEAFARVGMGVHDAFVACWKCKFDFNLMRPITYIHELIDPEFAIPLGTPPFPEYTSGHSVQSGATAQILSDLFGYNYAFTDRTHEARNDIDGSPRAFDSFFEMAEEAAISRLYGGIHYRAAIEEGVDMGVEIGKNIGELEFRK